MKTLRPETRTASPNEPCLYDGSAYFAIFNAVREQRGLIHGRLHNASGEHCAIGSYFAIEKHVCLPADLIEEVAAVNDSMPHATTRQRRLQMLRWLRWKLGMLGMPGFVAAGTRLQPPSETKA